MVKSPLAPFYYEVNVFMMYSGYEIHFAEKGVIFLKKIRFLIHFILYNRSQPGKKKKLRASKVQIDSQ